MARSVSRRNFVAALAGTVGSVWLATHAREVFAAADAVANATDLELQSFQVLTAEDARDIEAACALIIPTDETPGAREARVIHFIDRSLATFAGDQKKAVAGLAADLRRRSGRSRSFAALAEREQLRILQDLEKNSREQFQMLRGMTITGMLANPTYGGNFGKAGWKWLGFNDQFSWVAPFGAYDRS